MPCLTDSASSRKCALQGVSSLQVLQIPITGFPRNSCAGMPWFFIQERYINPSLPMRPNQLLLLSFIHYFFKSSALMLKPGCFAGLMAQFNKRFHGAEIEFKFIHAVTPVI